MSAFSDAAGAPANDEQYIAVGDIHGCAALLDALLARLPAAGTLVFLGDYLDRGPASRDVVERLLRLEAERPCVFLRGNHEAMMLAALDDDADAEAMWLINGGIQTITSYEGVFPDAHLDFLRRARPYFTTDQFIFVHGGLVPGCLPDAMEERLLWWIREPFLSATCDWGRLVIHGHTPTRNGRPEVRSNRINLDTGAVFGGRLTALVLPSREFIAVSAH